MSKKLFHLIKSLTPTEKAHFKKYSSSSMESEKVYVALFGVIDNMNEYVRSFLQTAFKKKKTMDAIAVYSNYLFGNILDALKVYHARKTADSFIKHLILDAEMLISKGIFPAAQKTINKAYDQANRYEQPLLLLEAISLEQKLALKSVNTSLVEKMCNEHHMERMDLLDKMKISYQYEWLYYRLIRIIMRHGVHIKNEKDLNDMEEIMRHPLLKSEQNANSISDKDIYFYIHCFYNYVKHKQDVKVAVKFGLRRKELFENNIDWTSQRLGSYMSLLNTLCNYYAQLRNVKEHEKILDEMKVLPERFGSKTSELINNQRLAMINKQFLIHCFISKEYEKGLAAVKGKEAEWEKIFALHGEQMVQSFYCNMYELFIHVKDYKKALVWTNRVLNNTEMEFRVDMRVNTMLWNMIIHYELQNFDLIRSLTRSTFNLLDNEQQPFIFERFFLNNMLKVVEAQYKGKVEVRKVFTVFRKELIRLKNKTNELMEVDYEDYLSWIDSHT